MVAGSLKEDQGGVIPSYLQLTSMQHPSRCVELQGNAAYMFGGLWGMQLKNEQMHDILVLSPGAISDCLPHRVSSMYSIH